MDDNRQKMIEHSEHPRNRGGMTNPDGIGEIGNASTDVHLRVFIRVDENLITDVRYEIKDCPTSLACASIMTELAIGKDLDEAVTIEGEDIANALGGLPGNMLYCSNRAARALQEAIIDHVYRRRGA
ncbi:MAG TPA: iron-sulfur cluster assembly scaffold protein [Syntrophorhabdaceae bacterium]|nr:iron-sulfur cluster assembly scaffold protein [Syntrophorhabdaceae bacterium]